MKKSVFINLVLLLSFYLSAGLLAQTTFSGPELVGCPTDNSIRINIVPDGVLDEYYYEYGTSPGVYSGQSAHSYGVAAGIPHEISITGLTANTRYYYRMRYTTDGGTSWVLRDEYSFYTQRAEGSSFVFTITSDAHAAMNTSERQAMQNINSDQPDFHIDLGDRFINDGPTSQAEIDDIYMAYRSPLYLGAIGHSTPIFLAAGNHENEEGWNLDDTPFSLGVANIQARKMFYPTPTPDGFYSGNSDPLAAIDEVIYGDELREDYYAFEWGGALFIVIDQFQYSLDLPYTPSSGEGSDDLVTGDQWSWTLGEQQYNWFKETLENSDANYKFVFSHHITGGILAAIGSNEAGYVRGGAGAASYFEWGGQNSDDSWGFTTNRDPGAFGIEPIHQLMVANGVSAYFHGHDHQYAYEELDGIVYQAVPSPSMSGSGFSGIYSESDPFTTKILPNAGHLRVSVSSTEATVDYVRSNIPEVSYTYAIDPNYFDLTIDIDPAGGGTTDPSDGEVHTYSENTEVTITAIPDLGYLFSNWTGDVTDPGSATTTIIMDEHQSVTANFVVDPNITIISPNGGEALRIGSSYEITWDSRHITGNVHIEYSTNNGSAWSNVIASTPNSGSLLWTIPDALSTECLIRISELDGDPTDVSDGPFTITDFHPTDNLIAYYPFNGNADDESGNDYHGTVSGASLSTDRFGNAYSAYSFDGINDSIGTGETFLNELASFSMVGWINPSSGGDKLGFWGQNDLLEFGFLTGTTTNLWVEQLGADLQTPYSYPLGEWHFVAAVGDGDSLKIYFDGELATYDMRTVVGYGSSSFPFNIGGGGIFDEAGNYFAGAMDDIRVFGDALSKAEIRTLFDEPDWNTPPDIPQNLTATAGYGEISLSWDPNTEPDLDRYNIYRDIVPPASTFIGSVLVSASTTTFLDDGVSNGQEYFYRITAVDEFEVESAYSDEVSEIPIAPSIELINPNGSEDLTVGMLYEIQWTSEGVTGDIHIEYSINGGTDWVDIEAATVNDGSYFWTIPDAPSTDCRVRISDADGDPSDLSDAAFTISPVPFLTVESPNGGEHLQIGTIHEITWSSSGTTGFVVIEYSIDNGVVWDLVTPPVPDNGVFSWTIPPLPSTECLIRIVDLAPPLVDQSDAVFTISPDPPRHFTKVWTGNGVDQMNFYALTAQIDGIDLQPDDEIGIFDGEHCVGTGFITVPLDGSANVLEIRASRDDDVTPEIDGYTVGHSATFRIWDASEEVEYVSTHNTYESGTNIFAASTSTWYHIEGLNAIDQTVGLLGGWNIFSLHVTPEDISMLSIVQSLVDNGSLVKIQNEEGAAIEYFDVLDIWIDNIGDWENTEGYKIRVNTDTDLDVTGIPVEDPLTINMSGGWNIISYPVGVPQDALDALDELVVADNLMKVQDEGGAAIEPNPVLGGWIDNIGDFMPGEGYKVRVNIADDLTIGDPSKSASYSVNKTGIKPAEYFKTCWNGNGLDHLNVYLDLSESGLQSGDEIGLFDGNNCVGAGQIIDPDLEFVSLVASADDPTTEKIDGFVNGNSLRLKAWYTYTGKESILYSENLYNTMNRFEASGTSIVKVKSSLNDINDLNYAGTELGKNYPNPFLQNTFIPFTVGEKSHIEIAVYDVLGQRVKTIENATYNPGSYKVEWNGTSSSDSKVKPGIYLIKMVAANRTFVNAAEILD